MLLDNKNQFDGNEHHKVIDFLRKFVESGDLDVVTGYFSVNALALLNDEINQPERFRMILGNLLRDQKEENRIVDLLRGGSGVANSLNLNQSAHKAVKFLSQEKVSIKSIQKNFCHAKTYIYRDSDLRKNFYLIGSSNLTDAGLGLRESSNIELNTASTGESADFKELERWFKHQWSNVAETTIELDGKEKRDVKEHIIELIKNLYREYTPHELYYKVLYELFKEDLLALSSDVEFKREIEHLTETEIYKILYLYQQKGAISLIKMLQRYNGAILADAVGLGKTWTALAVMKYFELKGYTIVLFCPKKLRNNWEQYQSGRSSRFEKDDLNFYVRNHTDLQDERLSKYQDFTLPRLQSKKKVLLVIDESHNLRNDKSSRYKFLVENVLLPKRASRDVKVLHLSATPINNKLIDIRNQFQLITKGQDNGFEGTELEIASLKSVFATAQKDFNEWSKQDNRKIADFIAKLPQKFFALTDSLLVARTRRMIQDEVGKLDFPEKDVPINEYITPENFGELKSFDDILNALRVNLTAYRPSEYITDLKVESVLENPKQREQFLVKMMYILLVKRLESSWFSFKNTVENILVHHKNTLVKVNEYLEKKIESTIEDGLTEEQQDDVEEAGAETPVNSDDVPPISLGKKNPVLLSSITRIDDFKKHLVGDIKKLQGLSDNLNIFESQYHAGKTADIKLDKLLEHIRSKQQTSENKKVLIFTVYTDTAQYLYRELRKHGVENIAYVSGQLSETSHGYSGAKFEGILQRFAPYTKLYLEKDWSDSYSEHFGNENLKDGRWQVSFEKWEEMIKERHPETLAKLNEPVDVLIATDCLSEGQNLQDSDYVINYDIHWNPVRLIQRFGRIDRLGSPNKTVKGINFWAAKDYEDYLKLKSRVEARMALMSVVGTELDDDLTPEFKGIVEENPLLPKQAEKMLEQLQVTWEDVETSDDTLGLDDLSLEQFRQELFEFFKKNEDFFKKIPNGVFTGFKFKPSKKLPEMSDSIVAVMGYPRRPDDSTADHTYSEIILFQQASAFSERQVNPKVLQNSREILTMIRNHKNQPRYVPSAVDRGDEAVIKALSDSIRKWTVDQVPIVAGNQIQDLFSGQLEPQKLTGSDKKLEEKYRLENFDLINWFVISNK